MKLQIYTDTIYTPHFESSYHPCAANYSNSYRQLHLSYGHFGIIIKYQKVSLNNSNYRYLYLLMAAEMLGQEKQFCSLAALMWYLLVNVKHTLCRIHRLPLIWKIQIWYYYFLYFLLLHCIFSWSTNYRISVILWTFL